MIYIHRIIFPARAALLLALAAITPSLGAADAQPVPVRQTRPPAPQSAQPRFNSDWFKVDKQIIETTEMAGENVRYRIRFEALADIDQVRLLEALPPGLAYVEASPAPSESSGGSFLWDWNNMTRGATKDIVVTVRPANDGWFVTNTKVAVVPTIGLPLFAGSPKLELFKTGPAQAELGDDISFRLTVSNVGNAPARNVIVTDTLPAGLYGPDRSNNVITHRIDTLAAGETRVIDVPVKAAIRGEWDNRANAFSTQEIQANASAHVSIVESKIAITKSGPADAFLFSSATYDITLVNEGLTPVENIQLSDEIPSGARCLSATDDGRISAGNVTWVIPRIAPNEVVRRQVVLSGQKQGALTANAIARFAGSRFVQAAATTTWEGAPGVLTEVADDVDPVKIGANVTYTIKITNQSTMRELSGDAIFDLVPNMRFVEISKNIRADVSGQRIVVRDLNLKPKSTISFKIVAQAAEPGLGGIRFEFGAGVLPRSVVKEETTYAY